MLPSPVVKNTLAQVSDQRPHSAEVGFARMGMAPVGAAPKVTIDRWTYSGLLPTRGTVGMATAGMVRCGALGIVRGYIRKRQTITALRGAWSSQTVPVIASAQSPWASIAADNCPTRANFGAATAQQSSRIMSWARIRTVDFGLRAHIAQPGIALQVPERSAWIVPQPDDSARRLPWESFAAHGLQVPERGAWIVPQPDDSARRLPWDIYTIKSQLIDEQVWPKGAHIDTPARIPFGTLRALQGSWGIIIEPGGPPTDQNGTIIIPVKGVYIVSNIVDVVRVPDGLPLETLSASVNIDDTSWTWSLTATLSYRMWAEVQSPVDGSPLIVSVNINGYVFQCRIEGISRARRFGETVVNISGRGIAAELAAPAAPIQIWTNPANRTAQQIMGDVLLNTGWTVDWQVTDWLVPANTFSKQGTPIDAINAIAGAIKASVQSDPSAKILHILPRYKVAPWNWATATPDVSLPLDPIITDSIEEVIRPNYNRVFVTGTNGAGRIGQVTINGTAGDIIAPTATDPLITAVEASQQLGLAILGDTGKQWQVGITGPVSVDLPLLVNGQLIAYDPTGEARRGQVRSIGMTAAWGQNGLDVSQSAKLEVHG